MSHESPEDTPSPVDATNNLDRHEFNLLNTYLSSRSPIFADLRRVQKEVWQSSTADAHFKTQAHRADTATPALQKSFFRMMRCIGDDLQRTHHIIPLPHQTTSLKVLDICMAPGGYSATALKHNPYAQVSALSLPESQGGHAIQLPDWESDPRITVQLMDITMLATELGAPGILPAAHPLAARFEHATPYSQQRFGLVFCDGQVLRTHRREWGGVSEAQRLSCAQLVIALQRIERGGTLVMLLHAVGIPRNVRLLRAFDQFSTVRVFKPTVSHATRSSFYLVAKDVDPWHEKARRLVEELKALWRVATLRDIGVAVEEEEEQSERETMEDILAEFGETLVRLGEPVWRIQKDGLKRKFLRE